MAKFIFYVSTGYVGSKKQEQVEIPDSELEGLSTEEVEDVINEYFVDWQANVLECGWYESE